MTQAFFQKSFESSIVKIQHNRASELSKEEAEAFTCLRTKEPELRVSENGIQISLVEKAIHKHF